MCECPCGVVYMHVCVHACASTCAHLLVSTMCVYWGNLSAVTSLPPPPPMYNTNRCCGETELPWRESDVHRTSLQPASCHHYWEHTHWRQQHQCHCQCHWARQWRGLSSITGELCMHTSCNASGCGGSKLISRFRNHNVCITSLHIYIYIYISTS